MPIYTGSDLKADTSVECDVCIVGSGAGGAHVAQRLANEGKRVVVLEDGGFHTSKTFDMNELNMTRRLYQEGGARGTADQSMQILQGRAVGGTTVVNWTTCFRTPKRVFEHWREHHGVEGPTYDALVPHWEQIEKRLNVTKMTLEQTNKNNLVTYRGAKKLGWNVDFLSRNVKNCAATGYCGVGCPIDAKQSMLVTMLPEAVKAGADVYANAWVTKVTRDNRKCTSVVASMRDPQTDKLSGVTLTVKAKVVVLAGGAINTPALLLRSGIDANGRTGMRTFLHPAVGGLGIHEELIEPFVGSPQYVHSDQFVDRGADKMGMLLEGAPMFPVALGSGFAFGLEKQAMMDVLPHISVTGVLLHDGFDVDNYDDGAMVTLRADGQPRVDYKWTERLVEGLKTGCRNAMHLQLAGGAKQVFSPHAHYARTHDEVDKVVDEASYGPTQIPIFAFHVMGGCPMGTDERKSIVDSRTLRHHGFDNMFVIDGSVYPTSLTVNPQLSIYGLASWASQFVSQAVA
ncbi:MAG: Oxidoreductase, family [Myxococcaceae bacterium]|nr:Oxidoreductase, family [Myxococcaceae bacterium]